MIKAVRDVVYITPVFDPSKSAGGIVIPDEAKKRCTQGIVKYIGPDVKDIEIGDYVLFPNYNGTFMSIEGEGNLVMMREEFVTARLDNKKQCDVPGLFFQDADGNYWTATYEMIWNLVVDAIANEDWYKEMRMAKSSDKRVGV